MPDTLVNIVIPTFSREAVLRRPVDSVFGQTHRAVEVLIVDDGSNCDTAAMVEADYGMDLRVRYLPQQNAGVSAARSRGLAAATGDYLALLDSMITSIRGSCSCGAYSVYRTRA